ncbi:unnamed protein product, partial [marine sediment metagenome]
DVLSGGTTPSLAVLTTGDAVVMYFAEAHATSDDYLFGKLQPWSAAVLSSAVDPVDGPLLVNTTYDVTFGRAIQHEASPVSSIGSHKIEEIAVTINLYHELASNVQEAARTEVRDRVMYTGDRIKQVLTRPDNLSETAGSVATGIISGMLIPRDLEHTKGIEDWDASPPRIKSQITGRMLVHVTQPTS